MIINKDGFIEWVINTLPDNTKISGIEITPHKEVVHEFEKPYHPRAVFQKCVTGFTITISGETESAGRIK